MTEHQNHPQTTSICAVRRDKKSETSFSELLKKVVDGIRVNGFLRFGILAAREILKKVRPPRCKCAKLCRSIVENASGLEVGGPSRMFSSAGPLPVYPFAANIDGLNFSAETVWASGLGEDKPYVYEGEPLGRQFIREACYFPDIETSSYDFVLSSHVIEHLANPLRGLGEWRRILRDGGTLILVAPHFNATFDQNRPVTTVEHMLWDFKNDVGEDDRTHIAEVLELHDFSRDPWVESQEKFKERCDNNANIRGLHHHVFDTETLVRLMDHCKFRILTVEHALPESIVIVCSKAGSEDEVTNRKFLEPSAEWRRASPFKFDRVD
jgi:SAM-dependent methyltransferase